MTLDLRSYLFDSVRIEFYTSDCIYNVDPVYAYFAFDEFTPDSSLLACAPVTYITPVASDTASLSLTWQENGTADSWVVEYGTSGFTPGNGEGIIDTVTSLPYTFFGLSPATTYDFYITPICSAESPFTKHATLSTIPICQQGFKDTVYAKDFYVWHNTTYFESGLWTYEYLDDNGCFNTDTILSGIKEPKPVNAHSRVIRLKPSDS